MNRAPHDTASDRYPGVPIQVAGALALGTESALALPAAGVPLPPLDHDCPVCRRRVTHAATLCGFCWTKRGSGRKQPGERSVDDR